ncbi:hypothetical protein L9F63_023558, partial [Diploptera punctata]
GKLLAVTVPAILKEGSGNVLISGDIYGIITEYTVVALLPHQIVIYGTCQTADGNPLYFIQTADSTLNDDVLNNLLQQLDLDLSDFVDNCESNNYK